MPNKEKRKVVKKVVKKRKREPTDQESEVPVAKTKKVESEPKTPNAKAKPTKPKPKAKPKATAAPPTTVPKDPRAKDNSKDELDDLLNEPLTVGFSKNSGATSSPATAPQPTPASQNQKQQQDKKTQWEKRKEDVASLDASEQQRANNEMPTTPDGYHKLLVASPNSSYLWCQYIAFWVVKENFEKARQTAEKALQVINYRESGDIMNVWMAYMNLEALHGTMESLETIFKRAVQNVDDQLKVYQRFVDICAEKNKFGKAYPMLKQMVKKYSQKVQAWCIYYRFCAMHGTWNQAKGVAHSAMQALATSQQTQIQALESFAVIQMKLGNTEKGRNLFEGLVEKYPKKTDVWSVYIDQELALLRRQPQRPAKGSDAVRHLRSLFERVATLSLPPKTMAFFLTRFMQFEKEWGTESSCQEVMQRAESYVQSKCAE